MLEPPADDVGWALRLSNPGYLANGLVEIFSLEAPLKPASAESLEDINAEPQDVNGRCGWCLGFDAETRKFLVTLLDGTTFAIDGDNLKEWTPSSPEDGGFDVMYPMSELDEAPFHAALMHCLSSKGYCVVQTLDGNEIGQATLSDVAKLTARYKHYPEEEADTRLGKTNMTKVLEPSAEEIDTHENLLAMDYRLSEFASVMAPVLSYMGMDCEDRTPTTLRLPFSSSREEESLKPKPMIDSSGVEDFITWVMRRHICVLHCIENDGGSLWLHPRTMGGQTSDIAETIIPLQRNRLIVFRNEYLEYSYQPQGGSSLATQTWLMSAGQKMEIRTLARPPRLDLAQLHIMSCMERFPINCYGADKVWAMFVAGSDGLTLPPLSRFDCELYYSPEKDAVQKYGKAYSMHGSFLSDDHTYCFDNLFYGIPDEYAKIIGPQQRWILETGYECLHKAGYTKESMNGEPIGCFLGDSGNEWMTMTSPGTHCLEDDRSSYSATRLSFCLGLRGPTLHAETACSASMVGVNACAGMMRSGLHGDTQHLRSAVCLGILAMVHPSGWIGECAATMLSFEGRAKTFNQSADGFIRGEGCSAVNIQACNPYADDLLETDGRLAVLYGTACNQDGRSASLTAPSGPSQQECIRISLRAAQINPSEVSFGECHGTGTALGDPIEAGANKAVLKGDGKSRAEYPHKLLSAKAHLGHLEACAGVCGLVKCTLMLLHQCCTPNPHLRQLNGHIDTVGYPVIMCNELTDSYRESSFGGISSFGFGGTNTRGDVWARAQRGPRKNGTKAVLSTKEGRQWINQALAGEDLPKAPEPKLSVHFGDLSHNGSNQMFEIQTGENKFNFVGLA